MSGDIEFEHVWFEYNPGVPVLKDITFRAPAGHDDGARGVVRVGQEHAHQPGHGLQPAHERASCAWTAATSLDLRLSDYRRHLGVVLQDNFLFDGTSPRTSGTARRTRRAPTSSA